MESSFWVLHPWYNLRLFPIFWPVKRTYFREIYNFLTWNVTKMSNKIIESVLKIFCESSSFYASNWAWYFVSETSLMTKKTLIVLRCLMNEIGKLSFRNDKLLFFSSKFGKYETFYLFINHPLFFAKKKYRWGVSKCNTPVPSRKWKVFP